MRSIAEGRTGVEAYREIMLCCKATMQDNLTKKGIRSAVCLRGEIREAYSLIPKAIQLFRPVTSKRCLGLPNIDATIDAFVQPAARTFDGEVLFNALLATLNARQNLRETPKGSSDLISIPLSTVAPSGTSTHVRPAQDKDEVGR